MLFLGEGESAEAIAIGAQYLSIMGVAYFICGSCRVIRMSFAVPAM